MVRRSVNTTKADRALEVVERCASLSCISKIVRELLDGTVTVRKIWDGRAQLEEIEADGPKGHWEGLTLFLYNPQSHEWNQTFISSENGWPTSMRSGSGRNATR